MKTLSICKVGLEQTDLDSVSLALDKLKKEEIGIQNWAGYSYKPQVEFATAHDGNELFLKFYVFESGVRAVNTESNQPVYQDSCVEFFTTPISDGPYYNFEFNAIGTCLSQVGLTRNNRTFQSEEVIDSIRRKSTLGRKPFEENPGISKWDLIVAIPLEILFGEEKPALSGKIIRGNFYKCGDKMSEAHYLSWNPIDTENPDFHRPEHFGTLVFE